MSQYLWQKEAHGPVRMAKNQGKIGSSIYGEYTRMGQYLWRIELYVDFGVLKMVNLVRPVFMAKRLAWPPT